MRSRIPQGTGSRGTQSIDSDNGRGKWRGFGVRDQLIRTGFTCMLLLSILAGSSAIAQPDNALRISTNIAPAPMLVS